MTSTMRHIKRTAVNLLGGPDSVAANRLRGLLIHTPLVARRQSPPQTHQTGANGGGDPLPVEDERARRARAIFHDTRLPTEFSVNLGAAPCNHSCLFCPQSVKKPKRASWLDLSLLEKVLGEMPEEGVGLNISSYSETLAAPNLVDSVRLMKKIRPKLRISMATNGSLFRERVIEQLIDAGLDHYQYSFDAPTRESYHRLMQVDHFDRVYRNAERILEMRDRKKSDMFVTLHVMDFIEIGDENETFVAEWNARLTGKDYAGLRSVGNWGGDSWKLKETMEKKGFTARHKPPAKRYPCNSIFMHFKLQHTGLYAPCVAAVPDHVQEEEAHNVPYIGDAREMTWHEAWLKLSNMRAAHLQGDWAAFECCKSCDIWSLWPDVWEESDEDATDGRRYHLPQGVVSIADEQV